MTPEAKAKANVLVSGDRDLLTRAVEFNKTSGCRIVGLDTVFSILNKAP